MKLLEAVEAVLRDVEGPLHAKEILQRIVSRSLWRPTGQNPGQALTTALSLHIENAGSSSLFVSTGPCSFALKSPRADRAAMLEVPPRKLGVRDIKTVARQLVRECPEGVRYSELQTQILDLYPETQIKTIQASIWNLDALFPDEVEKPSRGLFKAVQTVAPVEREQQSPSPPRVREELFYDAFADFLTGDLEEATVAESLGGAGLRSKWSTPDVIGVYKSQPSDRIKFPLEIISAEIKVDPQAPVVAFGQAVAYRLFSTKSYIVMPDTISSEDRIRLDALCMLFGVGFVVFNLDPQRPNFKPRMRAQRFSPDMYYVNQFADTLHRLDKSRFNRLFQ